MVFATAKFWTVVFPWKRSATFLLSEDTVMWGMTKDPSNERSTAVLRETRSSSPRSMRKVLACPPAITKTPLQPRRLSKHPNGSKNGRHSETSSAGTAKMSVSLMTVRSDDVNERLDAFWS